MVAEKLCSHFWGQIATKVSKHVAEPIFVPESRFRGVRWGDRHGFLRSNFSDQSRGPWMGGMGQIFPGGVDGGEGGKYFQGVDGGEGPGVPEFPQNSTKYKWHVCPGSYKKDSLIGYG